MIMRFMESYPEGKSLGELNQIGLHLGESNLFIAAGV